MKIKRRFQRFYLWVALLIGILSLFDTFLVFFEVETAWYSTAILVVALTYFFFNILSIFIFLHTGLEKINYILPAYHILSFVIFTAIGALFIIKGWLSFGVVVTLSVVSLLGSLFEISFSSFLLHKFDLWTAHKVAKK